MDSISADASRILLRKIQAAVVVHNADTTILMCNHAAEILLGLTEDQLKGKTAVDPAWHFFREDGSMMPHEEFPVARVLKNRAPLRNFVVGVHRPGTQDDVWVLVNADPSFASDDTIEQVIVTFSDITELKRLDRERESYFKFFMLSTDAMCIADPFGCFLNINPAMVKMTGYPQSELISRPFLDFVAPEDRERTALEMKLQVDVRPSMNFENRYMCKDGRILLLSWTAFFNRSDGVTYATARDITELRQAEEALRQSESKYRLLFENMEEGFSLNEIITDSSGNAVDFRILDANSAYERHTGFKCSETIGRTILEVLPNASPVQIEKYGHVALTGEPLSFEYYSEPYSRFFRVRAFRPTPGRFATIFEDITERKHTEEALQKVQKLESLGVLAGGIAHDFNNLMSGVFGYIDLANEMSNDSQIKSYLTTAMSTIERARSLTRQLLTFAKGGMPVQKVGRLFPFVQETAQFALSGSNVTCRFDIADDIWDCRFDRNQIGQVVDNLIINAKQAMPSGGSIDMTARNITLGPEDHPAISRGDYIKIAITDQGIGIPRENLARIFDPFFTTKKHGHGLGLATCFSIVRRHGGYLDVKSAPGEGSTFFIYLPASTNEASELSVNPSALHQGKGTFLVMDDQEVIRSIMSEILKTFGYNVVCHENGREAIDFFNAEQAAGRAIAGIIFDLTIPGGMGGKEAIKEIRKLSTAVPVFVASGYAEDPIMANPAAYGFTASICKPFRKDELARILNAFMKPG